MAGPDLRFHATEISTVAAHTGVFLGRASSERSLYPWQQQLMILDDLRLCCVQSLPAYSMAVCAFNGSGVCHQDLFFLCGQGTPGCPADLWNWLTWVSVLGVSFSRPLSWKSAGLGCNGVEGPWDSGSLRGDGYHKRFGNLHEKGRLAEVSPWGLCKRAAYWQRCEWSTNFRPQPWPA